MHVLHPHQSLDLGDVEISPRVPLRIDVVWTSGKPARWMRTDLRDDRGHQWSAGYSRGRFDIEPLPPGRFELSVFGPTAQWRRVVFELQAGKAKVVQLDLAAGRQVRFRARMPKGTSRSSTVRIEITNSAGARTAELHIPALRLDDSYETCGFAPGRYRVKATVDELTVTTEFVVLRAGAQPVEVVLQFR